MSETVELLRALKDELRRRILPTSIGGLSERLNPLSIGLNHRCPVVGIDARMFRVRPIDHKPASTSDVGAPSPKRCPIGRLNDEGQSVLYLADSPETAFAERGAKAG